MLSPVKSPQLGSGFSTFLAPNRRVFSRGCVGINKWRQYSMFLNTKTSLKDGTLTIDGKEALTTVPENIVVTPLTDTSAFVGATSSDSRARHVFKLGVIEDVKLLSLFRFKLWWMTPRVGDSGSDIPAETQMLLLEVKETDNGAVSNESTYIVFLPQLDGEFRSSLQGNSSNELEFCVESGSLSRLPKNESFDVTLEMLQCDVFTVSPIKVYHEKIRFAPIGLINMYNAGRAVEAIDSFTESSSISGRGAGKLGAYASIKPQSCSVNSEGVEFELQFLREPVLGTLTYVTEVIFIYL